MAKKKGKSKSAKGETGAQTGAQTAAEEAYKNAPHTFVFNRGKVGKNVNDLLRDMRRVLEPYTAAKLKVRKKNVLKDFVNVAGVLHVSHFIMFSKTEETTNMRVCRLPRGPTLTFQVESYSLTRDIVSALKRPNMESRQFLHHPLLVMNGFSGDGLQYKLMATMFQNMFPAINVNKVKLSQIRRCLMLNYNAEDKTIDFRHYNVKAVPVGMSRGVKKLIKARVPDLGKFNDMSDFLVGAGDLSESEAELDGPHNEVVLPQEMASRGNIKSAKSAIRLTEIGPRMTLKLVKIEEGICDGAVLHHELIQKTPAELELLKQMRAEKKKLKDQRKQQQEKNVGKKKEAKEEHKQKSLAGMKKKVDGEEEVEKTGDSSEEVVSEEEMDDAAYYRQEVGEDPEPELFPHAGKKSMKRKRHDKPALPYKKKKFDPSEKKGKDGKKVVGKFGGKGKSGPRAGNEKDFKGKGKQFGKFEKKDRKFGGKDAKFGKKDGKMGNKKGHGGKPGRASGKSSKPGKKGRRKR